jgi:hypothetical protein
MATFTEDPDNYPAGITVLETTDLVLGGLGEPANAQADELADRTAYLKKRLDPLLYGGLFPNGSDQQNLDPGHTIPTSDSGKLIIVNDSASGPFTGQGIIYLPSYTDMDADGLDGAVIGIASGDHSFELVVKADGGGNILGKTKPWSDRIYVGYGTVIFKYSTDLDAWVLVASDTSEQIFPVGLFGIFPTGTSVKPGWLDCDGSTVLKADYPLLWAEIGTTYGPATATEFTLPESSSTISGSPGMNMLWRIKF